MSKFKEGDEVTIKATVTKLSPEAVVDSLVTIEIEGGYLENCHPLTINQTSIVDHKPRPLQVGDKVRLPFNQRDVGTILAIHCKTAWIIHDPNVLADQVYYTTELVDLLIRV